MKTGKVGVVGTLGEFRESTRTYNMCRRKKGREGKDIRGCHRPLTINYQKSLEYMTFVLGKYSSCYTGVKWWEGN